MDVIQKTKFNFAAFFGVAAGVFVEIAATAPTQFGGIAMFIVAGMAFIAFVIASIASMNALKAYHMLLGSMALGGIGHDQKWWGLEWYGVGAVILVAMMWGVLLTSDVQPPDDRTDPVTTP